MISASLQIFLIIYLRVGRASSKNILYRITSHEDASLRIKSSLLLFNVFFNGDIKFVNKISNFLSNSHQA